ncbi:hypothetical protein [Bifidobacterium tibiigranuli]|uniref:hypothetical protein n=1 Tax=Bifidobacterium tibiigranuli TaxID=2172043 RepID=UPI00235725EA|nr:hypothetical protein [Bifidobacterium tibiigranuli]MCH3975972.1 hypothetical protein [Bifidobacterium tibiigranuli]MCH4190430.1 hypothetical protein [Bifidobacterium tibiigranuli]MCI1713350.1 hypothetical protein [Bifidobacterium tibiigranuli]MCI2184840.1 hypothetical protein [Bifidobacterium tibiigranuli]MCI2204369.1 hypothetical protein [Bifidobacterium tibiigranuli]
MERGAAAPRPAELDQLDPMPPALPRASRDNASIRLSQGRSDCYGSDNGKRGGSAPGGLVTVFHVNAEQSNFWDKG